MQEILAVPTYQTGFLILSFAVSVIGSFAALTAAAGIRENNGEINHASLFIAALALGGVAIWSMHFIGMMAYRLPVTVGFARMETTVSLVAAVVVAWCALRFLAAGQLSFARLLVSGVVTGLGVVVMHYLGMYGMRFNGHFEWSIPQVGASVVIAVVAATTALWLAFNKTSLIKRIGAALLMGAEVCAMHYTGMDAASPMCRAATEVPESGVWFKNDLQVLVPVLALAVSFLVIFDRLFKRLSASLSPANQ